MKVLAIIVTVVALLQALALTFCFATILANQSSMKLMRENIDLRKQIASLQDEYHGQTRQLCTVQLRMGDAYRRVLINLVERFGLNKNRPQTITNALLDEFEELGVRAGVGGP